MNPQKTDRRVVLVAILLSVCVSILFGEILARSYYWFTRPDLVPMQEYEKREEAYSLIDDWRKDNGPIVPHPYFGFVYDNANPGIHYNNHGFGNAVNFPYEREPDEIVIGIMGGSVAEQFAWWAQDFLAQVVTQIRPELEKHKITVLNFGMGCAKQPQQAILAYYYADMLDVIVNLDGFNEISPMGYQSEYFPMEYPCHSGKYFSRNPNLPAIFKTAKNLKSIDRKISKFAKLPVVSKSKFVYLIWNTVKGHISNRIEKLENGFWTDNGVYYSHRFFDPKMPIKMMMSKRADIWEKFIIRQSKFAEAAGIPTLFFLQPNLYVEDGKKLSQEELSKISIANGGYNRDSQITIGYQELLSRLDGLRKRNIKIFDMTKLFNEVSETVYIDACCHLNSVGNDMMGVFIAEKIAPYLGE